MGEVAPARTSPILHPPSPPTVHQLSRLALQELILLQSDVLMQQSVQFFVIVTERTGEQEECSGKCPN